MTTPIREKRWLTRDEQIAFMTKNAKNSLRIINNMTAKIEEYSKKDTGYDYSNVIRGFGMTRQDALDQLNSINRQLDFMEAETIPVA